MSIPCPQCNNLLPIIKGIEQIQCVGCGKITSTQGSQAYLTASVSFQPSAVMDPISAFHHVSSGNTQINCSSLCDTLLLAGMKISKDVASQLLTKHDRDRSGYISLDEFVSIVSEIKQWEVTYNFFDSDHSGQMDYNEFKNALIKMGYHFHENIVNQIFLNLDKDLQGFLNLDDFIKACSIIQIVTFKMQQYPMDLYGRVSLDKNQLLDIVFTIPM